MSNDEYNENRLDSFRPKPKDKPTGIKKIGLVLRDNLMSTPSCPASQDPPQGSCSLHGLPTSSPNPHKTDPGQLLSIGVFDVSSVSQKVEDFDHDLNISYLTQQEEDGAGVQSIPTSSRSSSDESSPESKLALQVRQTFRDDVSTLELQTMFHQCSVYDEENVEGFWSPEQVLLKLKLKAASHGTAEADDVGVEIAVAVGANESAEIDVNFGVITSDVVGCFVAKRFDTGVFRGQVKFVEEKNGVPFYTVVYTDGDSEDMETEALCGLRKKDLLTNDQVKYEKEKSNTLSTALFPQINTFSRARSSNYWDTDSSNQSNNVSSWSDRSTENSD